MLEAGAKHETPNNKLGECALIQLNQAPGRRWAFEHRRLCDVASDLNGWVMLLLSEIREVKRERQTYLRVTATLEPSELDLMDKLLAYVLVNWESWCSCGCNPWSFNALSSGWCAVNIRRSDAG